MQRISTAGLKFIMHWEGFCSVVYWCIAGYKTIGIGHLVRPGEDWSNGITEEEAIQLLRKNIASVEAAIHRLIYVPLSCPQFNSLCSFGFNLGSGAIQRSALRRYLNRGDYDEAAEEFPRWCWAGGRKVRGLLLRRLAEREMFLA